MFTQSYPNSDDKTPVIYKIVCDGDQSTVKFAVFGDGTHVVMGLSSGAADKIILTMEDQGSKEEWTLLISPFEQVIVRPDRSVQLVPGFVRFEKNVLRFGETENPILNAVASSYDRKRRESDPRD